MGIKPLFLAALLACTSLLSSSVFAIENNQAYFGFSLGTADDEYFDEQDSAFKLLIGKKISDNMAVEGAIVDLGEYIGFFNQSGIAGNIVGSLPLSDSFSVFAKAGLFLWTVEAFGATNSGTDLTYGFGIQADITDSVSFVAETEFFDVDDGDVSLVSAGLKIGF